MYPEVPMIALTATANARVKGDIVTQLNIKGCLTLTGSFNRANLYYEVRPKKNTVLKDIAAFIQDEYAGQCGIIYCLSKRSCEQVADRLKKEYRIKAHHYHAG